MTDCLDSPGWGSGFGDFPWGGEETAPFALIGAEPTRDNVIRLEFSEAPIFTGTLGPKDGSNVSRYSLRTVESTGYDGEPVRPVAIGEASQALLAGGRFVDLTLDRPMSPFPAIYLVSVNGLYSKDTNLPIDGCFASRNVYGLFRILQPQTEDLATFSRDIANPSTLSALLDPLPDLSEKQLGIIPVDSLGDYGFDEGVTNLKKRIYRRLITRKGAFVFMPLYGVGVPQYLKKMNLASTRNAICVDAQSQINQEPDIQRCAVTAKTHPKHPNLLILSVIAKTTLQTQPLKFDFPFKMSGI